MDTQSLEDRTQVQEPEPIICMCVVTRDRVEALRRCLNSMRDTLLPGITVVVSDDSHEPAGTVALCQEYPFVHYTRGPMRGYCANRNTAVRASTGRYLAFLDDDAVVGPCFFEVALRVIAETPQETVFTGNQLEGDPGIILKPPSQTFWGHFRPAKNNSGILLHMSVNLVPRAAFTKVAFDERIPYGFEEMDFCDQLLAAGYPLVYIPDLLNQHIPPPKSPAAFKMEKARTDQGRFYTSLKRNLLLKKKPLHAAAYFVLAPLHRVAHDIRSQFWQDIPQTFRDMALAVRLLADLRANGMAPVLAQE